MDVDAAKYKELGNECLKNKNYKGAVDNYTKAIELNPKNHLFFSNRSAAFASLGKYRESLEDAKMTVNLDPTFAKGYSRMGAAYEFLGDYYEAIDAYETCLSHDPNNQQARASLDSLNNKMANSGPGGGMYDDILKDPEMAGVLNDPSMMQAMLQALQNPAGITDPKVKRFMDKLSQRAPSPGFNPNSPYNMPPDTSAYNPSSSSSDYKPSSSNSSEYKPRKEQIHKSPAILEKETANELYKQKKFDEALKHYKMALEHDPNEVTVINNIAAVYFEKGEYKMCVKECKKAVEIGREIHTDYKNLARAFARIGNSKMKLGKTDKALEYYNKSLTEFRDPQIIKKVNQIEKERKEQERLAYLNPEISEEERVKGNECFKNGKYPEAINHYTESIKRNPSDPRLYSNRAACFTKLMEFQLCIKDCNDCLKLDPNFIKAHIRMGSAFVAIKQPFNASNAFEKALALDPNNNEAKDGMALVRKMKSSLSPEELKKQAMDDPTIQEILKDPAMHVILEQMQHDPSAVMTHLRNPEIYSKITKLMDAGIIQMK